MGGSSELRVGIIGAGRVARTRHLPGFAAIPGVRVVAVCNQRRETAGRVAREFDIPKVHANWESLIDADDIDAVVIATWPYMHCAITLAALDAGKHVLTQSRMAMNAREAQRMLDRSLECPAQATMVAPASQGLAGDAFVRSLLAGGYVGTLREIHVTGLSNALADPSTPPTWKQMTKFSGFNMLDLGELHEVALRWAPMPRRVIAAASKQIGVRPDGETGEPAKVGTPDSVQVLTAYAEGARGTYRVSGVVHHEPESSIVLYGSDGTLRYDFLRDEVWGARLDESAPRPIPIPDALRGGWTAEADFVAAARGERPVGRTTFRDGVLGMQFAEAVARSSRHQTPVDLPLREFSNPSL